MRIQIQLFTLLRIRIQLFTQMRIRIQLFTKMRIRIQLFTERRIRNQLFTLMRIRILILNKVIKIWDHLVYRPSIHFEPTRLYCKRPRPSTAPRFYLEHLKLLNFDLNTVPDPAFHSNADLDESGSARPQPRKKLGTVGMLGAPHQSDENLGLLVYKPSILGLNASIVSVHRLYVEPLKLLNFDFNADPDRAPKYTGIAKPDPQP
jgi:hypothetical protein